MKSRVLLYSLLGFLSLSNCTQIAKLGGNDVLPVFKDTENPSVTISTTVSSPTSFSSIPVTITFSENVRPFQMDDMIMSNVSVSSNSIGLTDRESSVFHLNLVANSDGTFSLQLPAGITEDMAGNASLASNILQVVYDGTLTSALLTSATDNLINQNTFPINLEFNEIISGLEISDFVVSNGSISNLSGNGQSYQFDVSAESDGEVSIYLPAGSAKDSANNNNQASNTLTRNIDTTPPSVILSALVNSNKNGDPLPIQIQFSENVTGLELTDFEIFGNGVLNNLNGNGSNYNADVSIQSVGDITIKLKANSTKDAAGNNNMVSNGLVLSRLIPDNPVADFNINDQNPIYTLDGSPSYAVAPNTEITHYSWEVYQGTDENSGTKISSFSADKEEILNESNYLLDGTGIQPRVEPHDYCGPITFCLKVTASNGLSSNKVCKSINKDLKNYTYSTTGGTVNVVLTDFNNSNPAWSPSVNFSGTLLTAPNNKNTFTHTYPANSNASFDVVACAGSIRSISMYNSNISSIPASMRDFRHLTTFDFATNDLSSIPSGIFEKSRELETIHLNGNPLTDLPNNLLDQTVSLERLVLTYTNLMELPPGIFDHTPLLKDLNLYATKTLNSLNPGVFDKLTKLETLNLATNKLSSIPSDLFKFNTELRLLYLHSNPLTTIPSGTFDNQAKLELLNLSYTEIVNFPAGVFDHTVNLENLSIYATKTLNSLNPGVFDKLTKLSLLNLAINELSTLPNDLFKFNTELKNLQLHGNPLRSIPAGIFDTQTKLVHLNLGGTELSELPPGIFDHTVNLENLSLYSSKNLSSLNAGIFDHMPKLRVLTFAVSNIGSIPDDLFINNINLYHLDFYNNPFSTLPDGLFRTNTKIALLNIGTTEISQLPVGIFDNITDLENINLYNTELTSINPDLFRFNQKLKQIELANNNISILPANLLDFNPELNYFSIYTNPITAVPENFFKFNSKLNQVRLQNTDISNIPATIFDHNPVLDEVSMYRCDQLTSSDLDTILSSVVKSGSAGVRIKLIDFRLLPVQPSSIGQQSIDELQNLGWDVRFN